MTDAGDVAAASPISSGPLPDWPAALAAWLRAGRAAVLVGVVETRGSTPREVGSKLLVGADEVVGTVGGGHLEFKAVELAREQLARAASTAPTAAGDGADDRADHAAGHAVATLRRFPLGPGLGQCCGGVALLCFEHFPAVAAGRGAGADPPALPTWLRDLCAARAAGRDALLLSRAECQGREAGKLLLVDGSSVGSLGDAQLDAAALRLAGGSYAGAGDGWLEGTVACGQAVRLLGAEDARGQPQHLLLEWLRPTDFSIQIYGAGHVGRALLQVLAGLPCAIHWVDSREQALDGAPGRQRADNIRAEWCEEPEWSVDEAPGGACLLVLTHSHAEDYRIVRRALRRQCERGDLAFIGLIGSRSKRRSFEARLRAEGFSDAELAALTCPIGISGIRGKRPEEIAIGVAAQLLRLRGMAQTATSSAEAAQQMRARQ